MRFLSSFDTEFKYQVYEDRVKQYGKEKILLVQRDKIFFILNIILPAILWFILMVAMFGLGIVDLGDDVLNNLKWGIIFIAFFFIIILVGWKLLKLFIDYTMDFTVVTPFEILTYNQSGFFTRDNRNIDTEKIKTISVDKAGILKSIFNYGTINILTEGDNNNRGDITLYYVNDPDMTCKNISKLTNFAQDVLNPDAPHNHITKK